MTTQHDKRAELIAYYSEQYRKFGNIQDKQAAALLAADAQAKEPKVVADALYLDGQLWDVTFTPDKWDHLLTDERYTKQQLITLQSHREAMAKAEEKYEALFVHLLDVYAVFGAEWGDNIFLNITQHSAKKDAALQACVEALKRSKPVEIGSYAREFHSAAITQAIEAAHGIGKDLA